jgi:hypothetical protein
MKDLIFKLDSSENWVKANGCYIKKRGKRMIIEYFPEKQYCELRMYENNCFHIEFNVI